MAEREVSLPQEHGGAQVYDEAMMGIGVRDRRAHMRAGTRIAWALMMSVPGTVIGG